MARQSIIAGLPTPVYVNETGTRQEILSGVYLNASGGVEAVLFQPEGGTLTISGLTPASGVSYTFPPDAVAATFTGQAPATGVSYTSTPASGTLAAAGEAPAAAQDLFVVPGAVALAATGAAPTAIQGMSTAPGAGTPTATGELPLYSVGVVVQPAAGAITATGETPEALLALVFSPDAGALAATGETPIAYAAALSRPVSDVAAGGWVPSTGIDLYAMLDEPTPSAADYISTSGASTCEVALAAVGDPSQHTGHKLRYMIRKAPAATLTVSLYCGATLIADWVHSEDVSTDTIFEQTLTEGEAGAITNYSDLRVKMEAA